MRSHEIENCAETLVGGNVVARGPTAGGTASRFGRPQHEHDVNGRNVDALVERSTEKRTWTLPFSQVPQGARRSSSLLSPQTATALMPWLLKWSAMNLA